MTGDAQTVVETDTGTEDMQIAAEESVTRGIVEHTKYTHEV